jgi:hypothetical protein
MHWEVLIVVIAFAVGLLSWIFGKAEQPQARRRPPGMDGPAPGNRPQTEIERFLEEISRMKRRAAEEQRGGATEDIPRPASRPVPVPRPKRVERMPRPAPSLPPRERPAAIVAAPPPVPAPPPLEGVGVAAVEPPSSRAPQVMIRSRTTPAAAQLGSLLRSPQALQAAVLLHEILGPPRCRHRSIGSDSGRG